MSRIGRSPVTIPAGVEVKVDQNFVRVKGPKGELSSQMHGDMIIEVEDGSLLVKRPSDQKHHRALHGLTRALINNMVVGVTEGFTKKLEMVGVGYRAALAGNKLTLSVGYSHPVEFIVPQGLTVEVPVQTKISVSGIDKQLVGSFTANIRKVREPEPYLGKGIKYEGELIRRKVGKSGK